MFAVLAAVAASLLIITAGAAASLALARVIETRHPPRGIFVTVDGVRLHLVDIGPKVPPDGDRPAVLLLHGGNLCLDDLRISLGEPLARRLRVLIPDRPGQGWSAAGAGPAASPAYQAALIRAVVRHRGAGRLIVVGHSLGGLIALRYVLNDPDAIAGLVVINPATHPRRGGLPWFQRAAEVAIGPILTYTLLLPLLLAIIGPLTARMFTPEPVPHGYASRSGLLLALTPRRFLASLREYAGLRANLADHEPRYGAIAAPTVIIAAEADRIVPPAIHAEALAAALPQARLIWLAGAGHMAHHAHAAAIAAEIERLAGLAGAGHAAEAFS